MKQERLLKTKTDKKQFLKWLEALRSGKYSQTLYRLQDEKGFCCLGVACKVVIPLKKQQFTDAEHLNGSTPSWLNQPHAPKWLIQINGDYSTKSRSGYTLIELNDALSNTFKQIASKLERVYKKELDVIK